jgi:hypothetical protein
VSEDKPLHVRVAEALGWEQCGTNWDEGNYQIKEAWPPGWTDDDVPRKVPRYDTDWSATGPLIEKYGIWLQKYKEAGFFDWRAEAGDTYMRADGSPITGGTPLEAVCHLILALKETGAL